MGCSTFTRGAKSATRRVADGERMSPPGKGGAFAPIQETTSTRATSTVPAACPMRWSAEGHNGYSRTTVQTPRPGLAHVGQVTEET